MMKVEQDAKKCFYIAQFWAANRLLWDYHGQDEVTHHHHDAITKLRAKQAHNRVQAVKQINSATKSVEKTKGTRYDTRQKNSGTATAGWL